jgi:mono/diheme cytochrome c family protein
MRDRQVFQRFGVAGAVLLAAGCGGSEGETPAQGALPVEVARVFQASCVSCHAQTPRFGAPMSLLTWADTQRAAPSDPSRKVWQLIGTRVHDTVRPMPPTRLATGDLAVIDAWVAAGAPSCTGPSCGTVTPPTPGTSRIPCTPSHTFSAHAPAGATGGFTVAAAAGNVNKCFAFRSPFDATTQATAFGPRIDNASVLHHMILFATDTPQTDGAVFNCDGNMPRDARFVTGWAPGNEGTVLPADVGVELPTTSSWFILQVHYWNLQNAPATDASGLSMCTTPTPREHTAAITTLGSADIAIPPRAQDHAVTGNCTPTLTTPVHIIGSGPHMHRLGTSLRTEIIRGGAAQSPPSMLVDVSNFTFDTQVTYPTDTLLMPGDSLRTTCRYRNTTAQTVYFGERTEDEMCFNFVLAWPAGALVNAGGAAARRCIDRAM